MVGLTDTQASVLRSLFGSAPDAAVRDLERALSEEAMGGGAMAAVYRLAAQETSERRARNAVFEPLLALCGPGRLFPAPLLKALWEGLRETCRHDAGFALGVAAKVGLPDDPPAKIAETYDRLCAAGALGLRNGSPAFEPAIDQLKAAAPDGPEAFANYLDLTPLVRAAMARLPEWVGRMSEERAAAVRVAYKDAVELADDAGPRFLDMLVANLSEPWLILRILSAVMDHPAEGFVAVSELAGFAERVLDDIDRKLSLFRGIDPSAGRSSGVAAAEAIHIAGLQIAIFESSIELSRDGAWGRRITQQKQALAQLAEAWLARIDKGLDGAMPLRMVKFGTGVRGQPKLTDPPDPAAVRKAEGLLAFFDSSRLFAGQSGYGAARAKAAERIEARMGQYVEDLLEILHGEAVETVDRARDYLEMAARIMEIASGEKTGQIIRRRAAAALIPLDAASV